MPTTVFLLQLMRFATLNKPPLSFKPPPLSKLLEKISPLGGLIEGLRYIGFFPMKKLFLVVVTVLFLCLLQTQATLTTNDIVINKLTQILLYLRQGTRGGKKVKKKEKGRCT